MDDKIDELDFKLIHHLQTNGRISLTELAERVGSTRQTISYRLKQLMDEELVIVKGGLNLSKFGFKMACVGLEVKNEEDRIKVEKYLRKCPRVLTIFRTPEKANIHIEMWGENDQTITSTIESFRDIENVEIVYTHYLGTPIKGNVTINVILDQSDETPCGKSCINCHRYINEWCFGCPIVLDYKNPVWVGGSEYMWRR